MKIEHAKEYKNKRDIYNDYRANGYVAVKNFIDMDLLDILEKDLNDFSKQYGGFDSALIELNKNNQSLLYEFHKDTCKLNSFNLINGTFNGLMKIISEESRPVSNLFHNYLLGLPDDERLAYSYHQESSYMKGFSNLVTFHYPLFRTANAHNGSMSVLKGSHIEKQLEYKKYRLSENSYTNLVPRDLDKMLSKYTEVQFHLDVSDVLIFDQYIIHRSGSNKSDLPRSVGIARLTTDPVGNWVPESPEEL